jgi:plasmid stabilization system protein ParE
LILIHPAAAEEARDARLRYARQDLAVARRFLCEYDRALERVLDHPERWPIYPHLSGGFRWCRFRRFPCAIIYELVPPDTHVLAVAADKRRPGYWAWRK